MLLRGKMKTLALFLIGGILGLTTDQIPFRFWFTEYDIFEDWLISFGSFVEINSLPTDIEHFLFGMLITIPFFTLLGLVGGIAVTLFHPAGRRFFIYGFLINIVVYFSLPHIPIKTIQILISSAAGLPTVRFAEVIFSNLYFLLSFFIAATITVKLSNINQSITSD